MKHRDTFREGVGSQSHMLGVAQPGAEFVQLQVWQVEMEEEALVQGLCMFPCASQPGGDGGLSKTEDPPSLRGIQPFSQREIRTMATCWEGVFRRYKGVLRRALNVVWHAGPRNVWMRSAWPCMPSPTKAWT